MGKLSKSLLIVMLVIVYSELEIKAGQGHYGTLAEIRGLIIDSAEAEASGNGSGSGNMDDGAHPDDTDDAELRGISSESDSGNNNDEDFTFTGSPKSSQEGVWSNGALNFVEASVVGVVIGVMVLGNLV